MHSRSCTGCCTTVLCQCAECKCSTQEFFSGLLVWLVCFLSSLLRWNTFVPKGCIWEKNLLWVCFIYDFILSILGGPSLTEHGEPQQKKPWTIHCVIFLCKDPGLGYQWENNGKEIISNFVPFLSFFSNLSIFSVPFDSNICMQNLCVIQHAILQGFPFANT